MTALATVEQMEARLGYELDDQADINRANAALEDASAVIRYECRQDFDGSVPPPSVLVTLCLTVSLRLFRNPELYTSLTVGGYTEQRGRQTGVLLNDEEKRICARYRPTSAGGGALWTMTVTKDNDDYDEFLTPAADGMEGIGFPMMASEDIEFFGDA